MFKNIITNASIKGKLCLGALICTFLLGIQPQQIKAESERFSLDQTMTISAKPLDPRAQILKDYLHKYNSPLAYHAQDFIEAADTYGVDWKLVPSIAGVESTFGRFIPGGYNAWGWGVYGDQALGFQSWKDGIYTLNKGLKEKYINRGLTNPYLMNRIYASSPTWGTKVSFFMGDLDQFSKTHSIALENGTINQLRVLSSQNKSKVAGKSATLTLNTKFALSSNF